MAKSRIMQTTPHNSTSPKFLAKFQPGHPMGAPNAGGVG